MDDEIQETPEPAPLTQADYEFIDEIITFENDGTLMTCDPNFYSTVVNILKKVVDIGRSIAKKSGDYDDINTMAKIGLLMSAMYFWSNDFTQKSPPKQLKFMDATCFKQYGDNKEVKTSIQNFQKYLCFAVFIAKGQEFDSKESFFIEWMSYSDHKKNLFNILVSTCLKHTVIDKRNQKLMPEFKLDTGSNRFQIFVKGVYKDFDRTTVFKTYYDYYIYATTKESDLMFSAIESTIKQPPIKQPTTKSKRTKGSRKESAVCDVPDVCVASNMKENPVCAVPDVCVVANKTKKNRGPKVEPKVEPTELVDDTGFTMVKQREFQFRYLLKSQDYDIIKTHTLTIMQPICGGFDGRPCLSIFKDKMSGKYIDIFIGGIQAAHISYYHHSKDQYHFKIDNPATFDLSLPPSLKQYTVPFNFHINPETRQLTFAIRQIDNQNTEAKCPDRIIQMVRDILTNHRDALQRVVQERVERVGLGYKPRKSKRCNRRDKRCKITRRPRPRRRL